MSTDFSSVSSVWVRNGRLRPAGRHATVITTCGEGNLCVCVCLRELVSRLSCPHCLLTTRMLMRLHLSEHVFQHVSAACLCSCTYIRCLSSLYNMLLELDVEMLF